MAKRNGLGMEFYFQGFDLSGDIGAICNIDGQRTTLEVTGINKSSVERVYGRGDAEITVTTYFNDATGQEHLAFRTLPTTDVDVLVLLGTTIGCPAAMLLGKQVNYAWSRGQDGSLTGNVQALGNAVALEWGDLLVTKTTISGAGNSPSLDNSAATCYGVAAVLHVTAFTGCTLCVALQESSDDGCADAYATIGSFTQVTAANASERITVTSTGCIERYLRLNYSGTFTSATLVAAERRGDANDFDAY